MADRWLEAALACVDMFYERMFRDWPEAITRQSGRCTLSYSGDTRLSGANHLWPTSPDAIDEDALVDASVFFEAHRAAWSVIYTNTYTPQIATFLRERNYYTRWSSPLMVLDCAPVSLERNPDVRVLKATTPKHLGDLMTVMSDAFATDHSVNTRVARPAHLDDPAISHYLIYHDGRPAACATVARNGQMAGVWNVGTRYRYRRRRYATTIMHAILDDLRAEGYEASMLMASAAGEPLYERLGYRTIGTTYYMGPPYRTRLAFS